MHHVGTCRGVTGGCGCGPDKMRPPAPAVAVLCPAPQVLKAAVAAPYVLAAAGTAVGVVPLVLLPVLALSLPAARALLAFANANHTVPELIAPLKKFGVAWHVAVGAALVVTLALGGSGS